MKNVNVYEKLKPYIDSVDFFTIREVAEYLGASRQYASNVLRIVLTRYKTLNVFKLSTGIRGRLTVYSTKEFTDNLQRNVYQKYYKVCDKRIQITPTVESENFRYLMKRCKKESATPSKIINYILTRCREDKDFSDIVFKGFNNDGIK